jgi:hypothetical protein
MVEAPNWVTYHDQDKSKEPVEIDPEILDAIVASVAQLKDRTQPYGEIVETHPKDFRVCEIPLPDITSKTVYRVHRAIDVVVPAPDSIAASEVKAELLYLYSQGSGMEVEALVLRNRSIETFRGRYVGEMHYLTAKGAEKLCQDLGSLVAWALRPSEKEEAAQPQAA